MLGETDIRAIEKVDVRAAGRSSMQTQPLPHAHKHRAHPIAGTSTASDRMASFQALNPGSAISPTANEAVLEWEPNRDPIGRLQALIDDKTWMLNILEATHTSLYNRSDALRRWPRRAGGTRGTEHRN